MILRSSTERNCDAVGCGRAMWASSALHTVRRCGTAELCRQAEGHVYVAHAHASNCRIGAGGTGSPGLQWVGCRS
eukprot:5553410-Prymnesium_polylepis.1